eukprot:2423152-Rhodomonas_salina.1
MPLPVMVIDRKKVLEGKVLITISITPGVLLLREGERGGKQCDLWQPDSWKECAVPFPQKKLMHRNMSAEPQYPGTRVFFKTSGDL